MNYLNPLGPAALYCARYRLLLVSVIWSSPFYILVTVMLKPAAEAIHLSVFTAEPEIELANFSRAWQGSSGVGLGDGGIQQRHHHRRQRTGADRGRLDSRRT